MSESISHEATATRIAKKLGSKYNQDKGVDIVTSQIAIEVETAATITVGVQQLRGHRKPVYIAGTNKEAVKNALKETENTTIGVMDRQGNIVKRSSRRRA